MFPRFLSASPKGLGKSPGFSGGSWNPDKVLWGTNACLNSNAFGSDTRSYLNYYLRTIRTYLLNIQTWLCTVRVAGYDPSLHGRIFDCKLGCNISILFDCYNLSQQISQWIAQAIMTENVNIVYWMCYSYIPSYPWNWWKWQYSRPSTQLPQKQ